VAAADRHGCEAAARGDCGPSLRGDDRGGLTSDRILIVKDLNLHRIVSNPAQALPITVGVLPASGGGDLLVDRAGPQVPGS